MYTTYILSEDKLNDMVEQFPSLIQDEDFVNNENMVAAIEEVETITSDLEVSTERHINMQDLYRHRSILEKVGNDIKLSLPKDAFSEIKAKTVVFRTYKIANKVIVIVVGWKSVWVR